MPLYASYGKLTAKDGEHDNVLQGLLQAVELVRPLQGCIFYIVYTSPSDPNGVYVMEMWESKEDHAASLQMVSIRELIGRVVPMLAGPPEGIELQPVGGKGL